MKIGLIVLVLFIAFCNAFSYWNMRCPSQSEWGVISSWVCNGTETKKYTCLYNAIRREYEESCKFQPVISGNGSQYVISVYPNSEPCRNYDRYQPFPLGSNAGSDCVFQKSTCSDEGNILFHHGSPKTDLSCRCNFQKGFGFVNEIPNRCDCIPSQEDCSCYLKQCPLGHRLISDYACLHEDDRKHIVKCPEMGPENSRKMTTHLRQLSSKELKNIEFLNRRIDFIGLTCLTGICIVYAIVASLLIITNKIPKMCYIDICPYNLEITPDGSSLRISWSISDKVPAIDILGYNFHYTYNGQWEQREIGKDEQYSFDNIVPSKTYRFKVSVRLRNKIESKCSEEKTFNTESFFPIGWEIDTCPFDLIIEAARSSLLIAWSISDKVPTIDILCYIIYYTYDGKWKHFYVIEDTECSFNKLKPSKTYRFKVAACFSDRVESKCTQEKKFITKLPITPKVGIPKGENSKIVLTWNSPRNTLIQIEGYEIQWSIDEWLTIADRKNVAFNVFRHEIETATEGVTYWVKICSFSNSVKSLYEAFQPFATRHDMFTMEVTYDTYDQKDKALVQNNVNERFKHTCNGIPGDQKKIHQSESEGSIVVTIMFISEGFTDEKVLHDTFKNTFQKKMIGSDTIKFKSFWLKRMNDPSPPQKVKASSVNNGVLVSWKEPFITFFKTKKYVVEYMEDDWKYPGTIVVPDYENSCFITKVLPSANIRVKVYTCICHKYKSSKSPVVSTVVKGVTNEKREEMKDANEEVATETDYEKDSNWLFEVLYSIGANNDYMKTIQHCFITSDIIFTFLFKNKKMAIHGGGDKLEGILAIEVKKEKREEMKDAIEDVATEIDDEKDSTWFYEVLDSIGANDDYRKTIQQCGITFEIISTCASENKNMAFYGVGGKWDGTLTPGVKTDFDTILCDDNVIVIEDISKAVTNRYSLLVIRDPCTPAGYVKLQITRGTEPGTISNLSFYDSIFKGLFKIDKYNRILLTEIIGEHKENKPYMPRPKNKPAATIENYNGISIDVVTCYRSKQWPTEASEWLTRERCNGRFTKDDINELKSLGYFLVRKGHVLSIEQNFEWRISLSLQERKLIFDLTDVQFKCYVVLKMLNRDIINVECITSYHWKTCLFYVIEEKYLDVWRKENLFQCVKLCITRMLDWVRQGFCPNYFILSENMFEGKLPNDLRTVSENKLAKLLGDGFRFLRHIKSDNICEYFEARRSPELFRSLRIDSIKAYKNVIYKTNIQTVEAAMYTFCLYLTNEKRTNLIELLWRMLFRIQQIDHITEHTTEETRLALLLLTPFVYTSLASHISAMCIREPNIQGRNFLLFGSFIYFMEGGLSGYLKFISVLYALGCYKECEWFLDQLDEDTIKNSRSYCFGHSYDSIYAALSPKVVNIIGISQLSKSTCVSFMPTELQIIPDAVKFEVFKYSTIPLTKNEREVPKTPLTYEAVVDRNIYYCLLKFLIKLKFSGVNLSADDILNIYQIKDLRNVRHPEVAYNLMAWSYFTVGLIPLALESLTMSWNPLRYLLSFLQVNNSEINYKNNQSNAANLHAGVILYITWFNRKSSRFNFCFQCFLFIRKKLKKCSKCKTATYCSEKCQEINWKFHEAVCKEVRKNQNV